MTEPLQVLMFNALLAQLTTPPLTGSPPIAYPLVVFAPVVGTPYVDARMLLRAAPEHPALDFGSSDLHKGVFQIDAVVPDGGGEPVGLRLAALIAERFAIGTALTAGAYKLRVMTVPNIAPAVKDAPWVRFPVSVSYLLIT